jgi:hypothetical protein
VWKAHSKVLLLLLLLLMLLLMLLPSSDIVVVVVVVAAAGTDKRVRATESERLTDCCNGRGSQVVV